jgi:hypothetical protein
MAYHLERRLLEVCDCRVLCPCWIGEDPDNGTCDSVLAYHFDAGTIDGVRVAGRTIAMVSHIPGNVLNGNFRVALYQRAAKHLRLRRLTRQSANPRAIWTRAAGSRRSPAC